MTQRGAFQCHAVATRFHIVPFAFTQLSIERSHSSPENTEVVPICSRVGCGATLSQIVKVSLHQAPNLTPQHNLVLSRKIADLVEVTNVNWNRNIGRVAVVEEMLE